MAIVIQEEKNTGSWFGFGILLLILVVLGIALYYLFFVQPQLLDVAGGKNLGSIEEFSQMNFDPRSVTESEFFKEKKQYIPLTPIVNAGNPRPFGVQ